MESNTLILRGAHVIDPKQGIDAIADVVVANQRIEFVGDASHVDGEVLDLTGHYLSPGWIDIHVHTYGTLGFSDPDAIGVYQGVTTFVDAGGAGNHGWSPYEPLRRSVRSSTGVDRVELPRG
jgi:dihydroorotase